MATCDRCTRLEQERDEAFINNGIASGFWGRATAREIVKRKAAERALAQTREALKDAHVDLREALISLSMSHYSTAESAIRSALKTVLAALLPA